MRLAGGVPWRHVLVEHALVALGPNGPLVRARTSTRPSNTCNEPRDWDPAGPRRAVTPPHRIAPALPPLDWPPPGQARPLEQGDEAVHVINFDCQSHCREVKSCHERSGGRRLGRHAGTSDGNVEDATAFVDRLKVVGEYEGEDGHELHENVERRARGVLEGVAHGVAHDGGLVVLGALALKVRVGRVPPLDVLLGVVPRTASVGHGDGELDARHEAASEDAEDGVDTEEGAREERGHDHKGRRRDHLLERGLGRDVDALLVVRLDEALEDTDARLDGLARLHGLLAKASEAVRAGSDDGLVLDLRAHLLDHGAGGLADGLHGHGREPVRKHGADEEEGEGHGLKHVDAGGDLEAHDEGTVEGERHERGRADGEALADGGGGVTRGVECVGAFTDVLRQLRKGHLGDAARVVADRTVDVDREAGGEGREHAEGSDGDTVGVAEREREEDDDGEDHDRDDGRLVAKREAVDDVSRGAALLARVGNLDDGAVGERGVVLGDEADHEAANDARRQADDNLHRGGGERGLRDAVEGELGREERHGEDGANRDHEDGGDDELALKGLLDLRLALDSVHGEERRDKADEDARSGDAQREHEGGPAALGHEIGGRGGDDEGCAGGLGEGAEEVRRHAGDVTDVVADVVSDGGGVTGVVLRNVELSLANKVSTNVGGLGVDAAANAAEHGDGRAAEAVARNAVHHDLVLREVSKVQVARVDLEEEPEHEEAEAAEAEAHHAARAERHVERAHVLLLLVGARSRLDSGARVREDGDLHADPARKHRGERTGNEGDGGQNSRFEVLAEADEEEDDGGEANNENEADLVLGHEEGVSALPDGLVDDLH
mmetsp:Transcript_9173/g.22841  ORF Transcript_9173/g.22841 Transcript_9173/m.22841 type:complete len:837 (+) Transcript_9173:48-2558(+)